MVIKMPHVADLIIEIVPGERGGGVRIGSGQDAR